MQQRDGKIDVTCRGLRSPFNGAAIDCLPVPALWLRGADEDRRRPARVAGDRITVGGVEMLYDKTGLHRVT